MKVGHVFSLVMLCGCAGLSPEEETMREEFKKQVTPEFEQLPATWKRMQDEGVTTETLLKLSFGYSVPSEEVARKLSTMLQTKFSYELEVSKIDGAEQWRIKGSTGQTTVTQEILGKWISYMVQAGVECGGKFEGWGATRLDTGGK